MFEEDRAKRSPLQIVGIIVIFILAILIICTFVIFGIFKDAGAAPKIFGSRVYVVTSDLMEPRIPKGSAVFVEEGALPDPMSQSVILCNIDGGLYVIGFVGTSVTESGETSYIVRYDNATDDRTWGISQNDIIGVAKKYDKFIGGVIRFASSKTGIMIIVIIPCAIVVLYEIIMLIISRRRAAVQDKWRRVPDPRPEKVKPSKGRQAVSGESGVTEADQMPSMNEELRFRTDFEAKDKTVEKQLKRANDKLNSSVFKDNEPAQASDISLASIDAESKTSENKPEPDIKPVRVEEEQKPSIDDLSLSRIDELIKLLEEEKKRLGDK